MRCPPGSLPDDRGCRAVVTAGGHLVEHRVDVGTWAALVLGFDGGRGSRELCQPLQQRAEALGLPADAAVEIEVSLTVPDQDVSRVRAEVQVTWHDPGGHESAGATGAAPAPDLKRMASTDVSTLVEALRGLGGQASSAAVDVHVTCSLAL